MPRPEERRQKDYKIIVVKAPALDFCIGQPGEVILPGVRTPIMYFRHSHFSKSRLLASELVGIALRREHFDCGPPHRWNERVINADQPANGFGGHRFRQFGHNVTRAFFDEGVDVGIDV